MFQMFGIDELKALFTDYSWILCQVLFAGYMTILAIMDIKWKQISLALLLSGLIFVAAGLFCSRNISIFLPAAGAAVGIVFIIISRVTEESFGYGDSILILIMGGFLGLWNILSLKVSQKIDISFCSFPYSGIYRRDVCWHVLRERVSKGVQLLRCLILSPCFSGYLFLSCIRSSIFMIRQY